MIEVLYQKTTYVGRLICLQAVEDSHYLEDGTEVVKNIGYDLTLMDANGAIIYLLIDSPECITFLGG
ncbi:MAG: hypothetical protein J5725_10285 [Bacteroidales bacterium]|nr:hypothetical protein [Bacteroidales bacterium]